MRVAIHQPNFVPHFGFFYKMSQADIFVILTQCQFEKNGYQNRYKLSKQDKWVTMPVTKGLDPISQKLYTNGMYLAQINMDFIFWVKNILSIETKIVHDVVTNSRGTQRLLDNLNYYGATKYIVRSDKDKPVDQRYLDEKMLKEAGIDIEYCHTPNERLNILEMFEEYGIEGTRKQLYKPITGDIKSEKTT